MWCGGHTDKDLRTFPADRGHIGSMDHHIEIVLKRCTHLDLRITSLATCRGGGGGGGGG